jgi:predicted dehydrogenase
MKRRLIQVGVGGWGATWIEKGLTSATWEVVGFVDASQDALAQLQRTHNIGPDRCFSALSEAAATTSAEAALLVVPPAAHLPVAAEAFDAGLHVLVEKPLADTMPNALEMVRLAESSDRVLMVSQNYRYKSAPRAVKEILQYPWLGKVTSATVEFRKAPHFSLPDVKHGYSHYKLIEDMSIHHFDLMRTVLGDEPTAVYAQARNPEWSWFAAPPIVSAVIELAGGGVIQYYGSWVSRGRQTTWDGDWFIDCENGQVAWANNRVAVRPEEVYYTVYLEGFQERNGWMEADLLSDAEEERAFTLDEFGPCLDERRTPETSGDDNLKSLALTYATADSAEAGERRELLSYLQSAAAHA